MIAQLALQYRVYAFDRPGHGYSERPRAITTLTDQVQLLHNALQTLGVEKPILVGHSWGCAIALAYALQYPKALSRIVLLAPLVYKFEGVPLPPAGIAQAPAFGTLLKLFPTALLGRWFVKQLLKSAFSPDSIPNDYLRAAQQLWTRPSQIKATFQDSTTLQPAMDTMSQCYPKICVPIVIVTGDSDQFVNSEQNAYRLHREISTNSQEDRPVRLIVLSNTGHAIPQTQPKAVVNAVQLCCGMNDTDATPFFR